MSSNQRTLLNCRQCGAENEWPYVFCEACGAPRAAIGPLRIGLYLSLIYTAFLGNFYFLNHAWLPWHWPLYVLYALGFTQFCVSLTRGSWRTALRVYYWCLFFFAAIFVFIHFLKLEDDYGQDLYFALAQTIRVTAEKDPWIVFPAALLLAGVLTVPAYVRLVRLYGWVNSYRVIILAAIFFAFVVYLGARIIIWVHRVELFPALQPDLEQLVREDLPFYQRLAHLLGINLFRVFLFEIFIFAAVRGYTDTRRFAGKPETPAALGATDGLTRSVLRIMLHLKRFVQILENMAKYLFFTVLELSRDVWRVACAFCRELLFPALILCAGGFLLYWMSGLTVDYVTENRPSQIVYLIAGIAALVAAALLLLSCKTRIALTRILDFYTHFLSWLLPNLLVFFMLLSVSLYLSSYAMRQIDEEHLLPFRIGILTQATAVLLLALVALILLRKKNLWRQLFLPRQALLGADQPADAAVPAEFTEAPAAAQARPPSTPGMPAASAGSPAATDSRQSPQTIAAKTKHKIDRLKKGLTETAIGALEVLNLEEKEQQLREKARHLQQRLQRKPKVLTELIGVKEQLRQKEGQLAALEQTRDKVSEQIYQDLKAKYQRECAELRAKREQLQRQLDEEHAKNLVRKIETAANIERLTAQLQELEILLDSGALDRELYNQRAPILRGELQLFEQELSHYQRLAELLEPEATR